MKTNCASYHLRNLSNQDLTLTWFKQREVLQIIDIVVQDLECHKNVVSIDLVKL